MDSISKTDSDRRGFTVLVLGAEWLCMLLAALPFEVLFLMVTG